MMTTLEDRGLVYTVDEETGEIVGCERGGFRVESRDALAWVIERIAEVDAELVALTKREQAILENIRRMRSQAENRKNSLLARFSPEMEAFVREDLEGKRERSIRTPFGVAGYRKTPGSRKVADMNAATVWALVNAPDAVLTEQRVLVGKLPDVELPDCFICTPPEERFYINTEVK